MTAPESNGSAPVSEWGRWIHLLPVFVFGLLAVMFLWALRSGDRSILPSPLIDRRAPVFNLAGFTGAGPGFSSEQLTRGEVSVVNVWATWCVPCHVEHPLLTEMKQLSGVRLYGIVYKDRPTAVHNFLARNGNPFDGLGDDANGRAGIDWGVAKVPETFVVDGTGRIVYKQAGPIDKETLTSTILPAINRARRAGAAARQ